MMAKAAPKIPGHVYSAKGGVVSKDATTTTTSGHVHERELPNPPLLSHHNHQSNTTSSMKGMMKLLDSTREAGESKITSRVDGAPSSKRVQGEIDKTVPTDDQDNEDEGDLQLFTHLEFEGTSMPKRTPNPTWQLYSTDSLPQPCWEYVNTFEYVTTVDEDIELLRSLRHLQHLMEHDSLDRYYILDEPEHSWAIVVCGTKIAMWAGATSTIRSQLQQKGVSFTLPLLARAASTDRTTINGRTSPSNNATTSDRPTVLLFNDKLSVRSLICSIPIVLRPNSKIRIVASHVFPNCSTKLNVPTMVERFSNRFNSIAYTTMYQGIFSVANEHDIIHAYSQANGTTNIHYRRKVLPITMEFNTTIKIIYPNSSTDDDNDNDARAEPEAEEEFATHKNFVSKTSKLPVEGVGFREDADSESSTQQPENDDL